MVGLASFLSPAIFEQGDPLAGLELIEGASPGSRGALRVAVNGPQTQRSRWQHQRFSIRMILPKGTIIRRASTRPQEQWHLNTKSLLKESHNTLGLAQATGRNGMTQSLAGLIRERSKQLVEAVLLQGLRKADATHLLKTEIETVFTDPQKSGQLTEINRLLKVKTKILTHRCNNLHWAITSYGNHRSHSACRSFNHHAPLPHHWGDAT